MHGPLEWNLVKGTHARKSWDRGVDRFEIHEVKRVLERSQFLGEFGAVIRLTRLDGRARTPLNLAQVEVLGYVADGLDAHLLEFLQHSTVDSWQASNVVLWSAVDCSGRRTRT